MSSTVRSFSLGYNPINKSNTFTSGDYLTGQITLDLAKDFKIDSLSVKLKGKAEVRWSETHNKTTTTYHAKEKYFSTKQFIIQEQKGQGQDYQRLLAGQSGPAYSNVVGPGCHVYPFTFQIPAQDMPSSFKGAWGKVLYTLEANLSRSMRMDSKANVVINFVSETNLNNSPGLMAPQHAIKDKKMKLFTSGTVAMDVNIDRTGFYQGEGIKIMASIQNTSSREIKPKYCIYRKHSFFARGKRRVDTKDLLKEVGEPIPPSASQTITKIISIPPTTDVSILNCNIIKVEHRLRVYLDVKYASDPEIKFPIVILPVAQAPTVQEPSSLTGFGFEAFGNPHQPEWSSAPPNPTAAEPSAPPPPYSTFGMYPSLSGFDGKS